jgi:cysteine desulfuration protein SufE
MDDNLIRGCQSRVWLHVDYIDGKLEFTADSDAVITKGLISLVIKVLSGHTPKEIAEAEITFIDAIGLSSHLSPTRSNGLLSMVKQIKLYAVGYMAKSVKQ